ncbi:MAG: hypothetical protein ABSF22_06910 [Bryobacteraceae bacterium]
MSTINAYTGTGDPPYGGELESFDHLIAGCALRHLAYDLEAILIQPGRSDDLALPTLKASTRIG